MTVVPDIWRLAQIFRSRIFQHVNIPDILKTFFTGFDVAYEIQGTFETARIRGRSTRKAIWTSPRG